MSGFVDVQTRPSMRLLGLSAALLAVPGLADDIRFIPSAGEGVSIRNSANSVDRLRVGDDGSIALPAVPGAPTQGTPLCADATSGVLGPCSGGPSGNFGADSGTVNLSGPASTLTCGNLLSFNTYNIGSSLSLESGEAQLQLGNAGRYLVAYNVNVQQPNQIGVQFEIDGVAVVQHSLDPQLDDPLQHPRFHYGHTFITSLNSGAMLALRLTCPSWWTGAGQTDVTFRSGAGANLTVTRVQ